MTTSKFANTVISCWLRNDKHCWVAETPEWKRYVYQVTITSEGHRHTLIWWQAYVHQKPTLSVLLRSKTQLTLKIAQIISTFCVQWSSKYYQLHVPHRSHNVSLSTYYLSSNLNLHHFDPVLQTSQVSFFFLCTIRLTKNTYPFTRKERLL